LAKMTIKNLKDSDIKGKRIFVRVDFNVPMDEKKNITDDTRIVEALPTIKYLMERGGRVILAAHFGRPKGRVVEDMRLDPVAKRLSELIKKPVSKLNDCIGPEVEKAVTQMKDGDVVLLENVRFYKEEEANDPGFAKKLASLAELYVNDAFGAAHRAHASTEGIAKYLPAVAGLLMAKEIEVLGGLLKDPKRPFVAILGGAKVSGKIEVIKNLLGKVDTMIVGGGMAYTFLKAKGVEVGRSLVEPDLIEVAKDTLKAAIDKGTPFLLPIDHVTADRIDPNAEVRDVPRMGIDENFQGVDVGPETVKKFSYAIKKAKTIFWNGPLGIFEIDRFSKGTVAVAKEVAKATDGGATSVIGGGDTVSAIEKAGVAGKMTFISTGGGASLEMLEGNELPGIAALQDKGE
jgi:phosphoglycerate kinase